MPDAIAPGTVADARIAEAGPAALAAAALLLRAPDEHVLAQLEAAGHPAGPLAELRQSWYDRFGIPQSGLYVPPFEHVFRARRQVDGRWHFPPARFDGAHAVEAVYARHRFRPAALDAEPMLRAPHLPGDHLGFMLAFCGCLLQAPDPVAEPALRGELAAFADSHLDGWVEAWCDIVRRSDPGGYPSAVADAVGEATSLVRAAATA